MELLIKPNPEMDLDVMKLMEDPLRGWVDEARPVLESFGYMIDEKK